MIEIPLVLGPVVFDGFELPTHITMGGRQRLAVHRLADGSRMIDVLGPDENDIAWSGILSGPLAAERAQTLDALRLSAQPLDLSFGDWFATVLVSGFSADANLAGWVAYRINCTVTAEAPALDGVVALLASLTWAGEPGLVTGLDSADLGTVVAAAGSLAAATTIGSQA